MEIQTISEVSKTFNVTTRTLRYYEQMGLLKSKRIEDYAYRVYDENDVQRLEQILILRKLQIPLKQIKRILTAGKTYIAVEILMNKIRNLEIEINALETVKGYLVELTEYLKNNIGLNVDKLLLADESIISSIDSIAKAKPNLKENNKMGNINDADKELSKLSNVRIVQLPPVTVASVQFYCDEPEMHCVKVMDEFVRYHELGKLKPDLRHYGFNNPNPSPDTPEGQPDHGYEMWVTIPEDLEVPEPLVKKQFDGGIYAAHAIKMGDFHEWGWLWEWVQASDKYDYECREPHPMGGCLEEHLNYLNNLNDPSFKEEDMQLDLLTPVKRK
jgi:DNA-binding transcriptional MerR regulator/DNA gyrase inhibitor GyrI